MTRPLSMDLRECAMARLASGESVRRVAASLSVAPSNVVKWSQRFRATGSFAPAPVGGQRPRKIVGAHEAWLLERIESPFTLRVDRIDAPCVLDGPVSAKAFQTCVEHFLIPTLAPGDVVVMDNLSSHKSAPVRKAIRKAGAHLLFLPPYSPDLNPIEQVFAKLKHMLREAAERTADATCQRIGDLLNRFSPNECANYFSNAGYASV